MSFFDTTEDLLRDRMEEDDHHFSPSYSSDSYAESSDAVESETEHDYRPDKSLDHGSRRNSFSGTSMVLDYSSSSPMSNNSPIQSSPPFAGAPQESIPMVPIKRKRGRPPKNPQLKLLQAQQANAGGPPPIKRGRGRPRKHPLPAASLATAVPTNAEAFGTSFSAAATGKSPTKQPSDSEICTFVKDLLADGDLPMWMTAEFVKLRLENHFRVSLNSRRHFVDEVFQVLRV
eukprot:TRINITY_DN2943_c0_g1_i3.p1 TRINITY_DN2943_c0_g1~~TRINITY_DN2943_c0_g1_i3.p1  ORF type:complete len:231 (-),score=12.72 TRINITY_DN2943_c0_g1_i3:123-815(-)